jgi:hypothetical protein
MLPHKSLILNEALRRGEGLLQHPIATLREQHRPDASRIGAAGRVTGPSATKATGIAFPVIAGAGPPSNKKLPPLVEGGRATDAQRVMAGLDPLLSGTLCACTRA